MSKILNITLCFYYINIDKLKMKHTQMRLFWQRSKNKKQEIEIEREKSFIRKWWWYPQAKWNEMKYDY